MYLLLSFEEIIPLEWSGYTSSTKFENFLSLKWLYTIYITQNNIKKICIYNDLTQVAVITFIELNVMQPPAGCVSYEYSMLIVYGND